MARLAPRHAALVVVGGLATAKSFDTGSPVYPKTLTAAQIRQMLGLK